MGFSGNIWRIVFALAVLGTSGCAIRPEPMSERAFERAADINIASVSADQVPLNGPIDLHDAMARALKYNLQRRVDRAQAALRTTELGLEHYSLLPSAVINSGYASRSNFAASSSLNLETDTNNFGFSTSQDKSLRTGDLTLSWNVLDFGLSYVRARQAADQVLIAREIERRTTHKLLEEVRTAFWRTAGYQKLIRRLRGIETRTKAALGNNRALSRARRTNVFDALTAERQLVEIKRSIKKLERDVVDANAKLANLLNVDPGTRIRVAAGRFRDADLKLPAAPRELIRRAVRDRSELRENLYIQRINLREADAALLELLPGLQAHIGRNGDSNSFLLNRNWVSLGAKASWHLLNVFRYPAKRAVVDAREEVLRTKAMALTMSVITQVYVSIVKFHHHRAELKTAEEFLSVQRRLVRQARNEAAASRLSENELLSEEMQMIVAEMEFDLAKSRLRSAYATVFASIGHDFYPHVDDSQDLARIKSQLISTGAANTIQWAAKVRKAGAWEVTIDG